MTSQAEDAGRKRGRPRNVAARDRALRTARDILLTEGFGRLTMEEVASRAGVSKPTLYRYWANAQQLALSALMPPERPGDDPSAPAKARLQSLLETLVDTFASTRGRQIAVTLASADPESELTRAFRNRVLQTSREHGRTILAGAVESGELAAPNDLEATLDMIFAPLFYRLLMGHAPLDRAMAASLVDTIWAANRAGPDGRTRS